MSSYDSETVSGEDALIVEMNVCDNTCERGLGSHAMDRYNGLQICTRQKEGVYTKRHLSATHWKDERGLSPQLWRGLHELETLSFVGE